MKADLNFETKTIIEKMKVNKTTHIAAYEEALDAYWKNVCFEVESLHVQLEDVNNNEDIEDIDLHAATSLIRPQSHTEAYERVITMLGDCIDEYITLSEPEYSQYILDDWHWKREFAHAYLSNTAKVLA